MLNAANILEEIEKEHGFLLAELGRLDSTLATLPCAGDCDRAQPCSPSLEASCQGILDDFAGSLIGLMQQHFAHEEQHMKVLDHPHLRDMFERHKEAHADLTQAVSATLYAESTRAQRESISRTIAHWLTDHIATHDQALLNWLLEPA